MLFIFHASQSGNDSSSALVRLASFPDSETAGYLRVKRLSGEAKAGPPEIAAEVLRDSSNPPGIWASVVQACPVAGNVCTKMLFVFLSLQNYDEGNGANK
jgi:hypothetical protein